MRKNIFLRSTSLVAKTSYSPQPKKPNPKTKLRTLHPTQKTRFIYVIICNVGNIILAGSDSKEK